MDINNPTNFVDYYFNENGDDAEDEFAMNLNVKHRQALLEINLEMILYLFLHLLLLIIDFKDHQFNTDINTHKYTNKHSIKMYYQCIYTIIIIKKKQFFPLIYKNEWKKHKN